MDVSLLLLVVVIAVLLLGIPTLDWVRRSRVSASSRSGMRKRDLAFYAKVLVVVLGLGLLIIIFRFLFVWWLFFT